MLAVGRAESIISMIKIDFHKFFCGMVNMAMDMSRELSGNRWRKLSESYDTFSRKNYGVM